MPYLQYGALVILLAKPELGQSKEITHEIFF